MKKVYITNINFKEYLFIINLHNCLKEFSPKAFRLELIFGVDVDINLLILKVLSLFDLL